MPLFEVTYKLVDAHNGESQKTWQVDALDHAAAVTAAAAFATSLMALTEMELLQHTVKEIVIDSDTVTAGANKDEGATFSVRKASNKKDVIKVPAPIAVIRNADRTLDITHAAVTGFLAEFTANGWRISDGEVVTQLLGGTLDE